MDQELSDWINAWPTSWDNGMGRGKKDVGDGGPAADSLFNERACALFRIQHRLNPIYRAWCGSRGVRPLDVSHWHDIPALPVDAFKEARVSCLSSEEEILAFSSSGTTGQRSSLHRHSGRTLALYSRVARSGFDAHFPPPSPDDVSPVGPGGETAGPDYAFVSMTPSPEQSPDSSLAWMLNEVGRRSEGGTVFCGKGMERREWVLDGTCLLRRVDQARQAGRPVLLMGTAFHWVQWADEVRGLSGSGAGSSSLSRLPPGSAVLETGGYKGRTRELDRDALHDLIAGLTGISPDRIVTEYGMCELSSQAYDRRVGGERNGLRFPPWVRVRLRDPETQELVGPGGIGRVEVVDLANAGSVLAVATGDLGRRLGEGTCFEWVGRMTGAEPRGCSLRSLETRPGGIVPGREAA